MIVAYRRRPPRIYLLGRHLHHGRTGELMILIGLLLMAHDRRDWPFRWVTDFDRYE